MTQSYWLINVLLYFLFQTMNSLLSRMVFLILSLLELELALIISRTSNTYDALPLVAMTVPATALVDNLPTKLLL